MWNHPRCRGLAVWLVLVVLASSPLCHASTPSRRYATKNQKTNDKQYFNTTFSRICYRRGPVVSYLQRTQPWKQHSRRVLDWGCGSGALAADLARAGASRVTAVDLHPVDAARKRLQPYPHATAQRTSPNGILRGTMWGETISSLMSLFRTWGP